MGRKIGNERYGGGRSKRETCNINYKKKWKRKRRGEGEGGKGRKEEIAIVSRFTRLPWGDGKKIKNQNEKTERSRPQTPATGDCPPKPSRKKAYSYENGNGTLGHGETNKTSGTGACHTDVKKVRQGGEYSSEKTLM